MFGKSSHTDLFISTYSALVVFNWSGLSPNFSNSTHRRPPLVLYPCFIFLHGSHHSLTLFAYDLSFPIRTKQRWYMSHFFIVISTSLEIDLLVYSRFSLVEWNNFYIVILPSLRHLPLVNKAEPGMERLTLENQLTSSVTDTDGAGGGHGPLKASSTLSLILEWTLLKW